MWITTDVAGHITGRYNTKQPGLNCIEVTDAQLASVAYPKWDKKKKQIVNDGAAQAAADTAATAEKGYAYARARALAYTEAFSKDPNRSQIDALGHVLDAVLSHFAGDSTELNSIQQTRAAIKAAHPKP